MTLDLQADAAIFGGDFGETVTYHPQGGEPRELENINVIRDPPELLDSLPSGATSPVFIVIVPNSVTTGIARSELDRGRDEIELPIDVGGDTTRRKIKSVLSEDGGMLRLEVR